MKIAKAHNLNRSIVYKHYLKSYNNPVPRVGVGAGALSSVCV